jgi:hypothetical protein
MMVACRVTATTDCEQSNALWLLGLDPSDGKGFQLVGYDVGIGLNSHIFPQSSQ